NIVGRVAEGVVAGVADAAAELVRGGADVVTDQALIDLQDGALEHRAHLDGVEPDAGPLIGADVAGHDAAGDDHQTGAVGGDAAEVVGEGQAACDGEAGHGDLELRGGVGLVEVEGGVDVEDAVEAAAIDADGAAAGVDNGQVAALGQDIEVAGGVGVLADSV